VGKAEGQEALDASGVADGVFGKEVEFLKR
jgi:hypothetical protein